MVWGDKGEESKVRDSPLSHKDGLSIGVLCWMTSICGEMGAKGLWSRLGLTETLKLLDSATGTYNPKP